MNKKIIIVLRPKSPVDGGWTEWSGWSTCDIDCLKSRVRECKNPAPFEGGSECPGNSTETDSCCGGDCWGKVNVKFYVCFNSIESKLYKVYKQVLNLYI